MIIVIQEMIGVQHVGLAIRGCVQRDQRSMEIVSPKQPTASGL